MIDFKTAMTYLERSASIVVHGNRYLSTGIPLTPPIEELVPFRCVRALTFQQADTTIDGSLAWLDAVAHRGGRRLWLTSDCSIEDETQAPSVWVHTERWAAGASAGDIRTAAVTFTADPRQGSSNTLARMSLDQGFEQLDRVLAIGEQFFDVLRDVRRRLHSPEVRPADDFFPLEPRHDRAAHLFWCAVGSIPPTGMGRPTEITGITDGAYLQAERDLRLIATSACAAAANAAID